MGDPEVLFPILILFLGIVVVLGMIIWLRVNAFIALITASILVSLLSPGETATKISRVADAFGSTAGKIGIVIALAAVIGGCMMESGAADRIVRAFLQLLGHKRTSFALMGSGFVLAIPVFFDTVFYLLVPLARSLYAQTRRNYLTYLLAIASGGAITHSLVPPTPGPLVMAETLGVDLGTMIFAGILVALPAALAGMVFANVADRMMPIEMRAIDNKPDSEPLDEKQLPPLLLAILPVVLPVLMITTNTVVAQVAKGDPGWKPISEWTAVIGNPNLALLTSAAVAVLLYVVQRKATRQQVSSLVETSLMSAGVIILITAGGGAFGATLQEAKIGPAIQSLFQGEQRATGMTFLFLAFLVASLLKVAQGSGTVSMITTSAMMAAMLTGSDDRYDPSMLGFHPVYLALAVGSGSLVGSWMNDSGFWIFAKMGGLTETESLKSWTLLLIVLGCTSFTVTAILAVVLPMT